MKLRKLILILLLSIVGISNSFANDDRSPKIPLEEIVSEENRSGNEPIREWPRTNTSVRISFPTSTGFVLLRKEDLIYLTTHPKSENLLLAYWSRGTLKEATCNLSITKALEILKGFPFAKISRSTIVNMHEVNQYEGTRRDAVLRMSDDTRLKISRNYAGSIHDWIRDLGKPV